MILIVSSYPLEFTPIHLRNGKHIDLFNVNIARWNSKKNVFQFAEEWSLLANDDDGFGEDDLGFDPFHETQKALAEMIESESKQVTFFTSNID